LFPAYWARPRGRRHVFFARNAGRGSLKKRLSGLSGVEFATYHD
jgi:hypothetical protein